MGRRTHKFIIANNRKTAEGQRERRCYKCAQWTDLELFKTTHGVRSYICLPCEAKRRRTREAAKVAAGCGRSRAKGIKRYVPAQAIFDDARVDVFGLMCFATMPTPQQLIERKAA